MVTSLSPASPLVQASTHLMNPKSHDIYLYLDNPHWSVHTLQACPGYFLPTRAADNIISSTWKRVICRKGGKCF